MRDLSFSEETIEAGGQRVIAAKIECSCCPAVGYYPRKRGAARRPPDAIAAHFRKQGWNLKGSKVRCPECARRRPRAHEEQMMVRKVPKSSIGEPVDVLLVPAVGEGGEPLRPMTTLEDKQVINMKLMDVYDRPEVGYKPGWSDALVARDLGVQKEWVADIRALMFGPHGSSAALDAFFEGVAEVQKIAGSIQSAQTEACRAVADLRAQLDTIDGDLRSEYIGVRDLVSSVQKLGDAVRAEIAR